MRRKVRAGAGERDEIYQLRVPPAPIPPAWGRTVQPYVPPYLRSQRPMAGAAAPRQGSCAACVLAGKPCIGGLLRRPAAATCANAGMSQCASLPHPAVPVPPALLKAMREGGRAMDIEAMQGCTYREEPRFVAGLRECRRVGLSG